MRDTVNWILYSIFLCVLTHYIRAYVRIMLASRAWYENPSRPVRYSTVCMYSVNVYIQYIYVFHTLMWYEYCINGQATEYVRTIIMSGTIFKITFLQVPSFMIILSFTSHVKAKISFLKINLSEILKLHLFRSSDAKFLAVIQFACIMARINFMLLHGVGADYSIQYIQYLYNHVLLQWNRPLKS